MSRLTIGASTRNPEHILLTIIYSGDLTAISVCVSFLSCSDILKYYYNSLLPVRKYLRRRRHTSFDSAYLPAAVRYAGLPAHASAQHGC